MKTNLLLSTFLDLPCFGFIPSAFTQPAILNAGWGFAFENAGVVVFTVWRSDNTKTVVTVDYETKDGSAKAGVDYSRVSGTLAFAAGETEKTISIPLADDDGLLDGDKTFRVCLTNATGGALVETSEGIVTIQDNEVPANLDYSFNPVISSGDFEGEVLSFATLPDGKLVIGGYFTRVNGVERSGLAGLNADGSLAAAFQTRVLYAGQPAGVDQVTPLPDGRVYIAGNFDSVNGVARPGLARLLPDGLLDSTFAPTNSYFSMETVQADGKIIALTDRDGLVRLDLDGRRDNSFVTSLLTSWQIYAFAEHTDGKHGLGRILLDTPPRTGIDIQSVETRFCACSAYLHLRTIGENDGSLTVKVRRLGETTGPATVSYGTRGGTAKAGQDYIATSGMLSFAPLEVEKIVTVPILDNAAFEGRRTLQLYLTNAVGADFIAPPLTVTILDDEVGFEPGTIERLADGSVRMIAEVSSFQSLYFEVSNDLKSWSLATRSYENHISPFEIEFTDLDAANFPRRFYLLRNR